MNFFMVNICLRNQYYEPSNQDARNMINQWIMKNNAIFPKGFHENKLLASNNKREFVMHLQDQIINIFRESFMQHKDHSYFMINKASLTEFRSQDIRKYYDIQQQPIGRGAYGIVFKAKEKSPTASMRAIKAISKKMIKSIESLVNELENLSVLDHPNIIRLYETFEDRESVFIVTDLCEGGELFDKIATLGSLTESDAREIFIQIIQTINYCNLKKIAHRDLKPENFLFLNKSSLNLKLIDFGLSYKWNNSMREQLIQNNQNKLIGTPYYISPEIVDGSYDERCDLWSAGVILYILFSGTPPFYGETTEQIIKQIKKGNVRLGIPQMEGLSPQGKDLICRLLKPEKERITIQQIFKHPWIKLKIPRKELKVNYNRMRQFVNFSKLKKITATFISFRLSENEDENLLSTFKQIDKNHDGHVCISQLKHALQEQKENKTFEQLKQIIEGIDANPQQKINYLEFMTANLDEKYILKRCNLENVFNILDMNGDGCVDKQQLTKVLVKNKMINLSINGTEVDDIIVKCDRNKDGNIDFEEFVKFIVDE